MNLSFVRPLSCTLLCGLLYSAAATSVLGQGGDNPTGVSGVFNGNSTTGCSYDPYTANAQRIIPDLTVAGGVGKYPLQWSRIMNSRGPAAGVFGTGGGWSHSYQWKISCESDNNLGAPLWYTVSYPDGRVVTFSAGVSTPYLPPLGVRDRITPFIYTGTGTGTGYVYLNLTDGGKVRFPQTTIYHGPSGAGKGSGAHAKVQNKCGDKRQFHLAIAAEKAKSFKSNSRQVGARCALASGEAHIVQLLSVGWFV